MDMLFDPYADGPFKAGTHTAALTKSRPEPGLAPAEFGGGGHASGEPGQPEPVTPGPDGGAGGNWARPALPDAGALLQGLNPQQEEAVKHAGSALLIVVATLAAWLPSRAATRVDPSLPLRGD